MPETCRRITTTINADATLTVALSEAPMPEPGPRELVVRVEAAPINPSDIGVLFGVADLSRATFSPGRIDAPLPEAMVKVAGSVVGVARPAGNEFAGTVIAAGSDPMAQALIGKRVAAVSGGGYADFALADVFSALVLPDDVSSEEGASAFVNPLTALGFLETVKRDGHKALIHTAAASALGQMLVKAAAEDGIAVVNVVRSAEQSQMLRSIGAQHIVDSSAPDFAERLVEAVAATGAMVAFDAIGGGTMAGRLLTAMETVAMQGQTWTQYGSNVRKRVWIYGALDMGPTVLNRGFGFQWDVGGWLLTPFLQSVGLEGAARLRARVVAGLKTTFATTFGARTPLSAMLDPETVAAYTARRTGEKFLVVAG